MLRHLQRLSDARTSLTITAGGSTKKLKHLPRSVMQLQASVYVHPILADVATIATAGSLTRLHGTDAPTSATLTAARER